MGLGPIGLIQEMGVDLPPQTQPPPPNHRYELLTASLTPAMGRNPQERADSTSNPPRLEKVLSSPTNSGQSCTLPSLHTPFQLQRHEHRAQQKRSPPHAEAAPGKPGPRSQSICPRSSQHTQACRTRLSVPHVASSARTGRAGHFPGAAGGTGGRLPTPEGHGAGRGPPQGQQARNLSHAAGNTAASEPQS